MSAEPHTDARPAPKGVLVPAPTAWPFTLAVGSALILAGLLTNASVSVLGAIVAVFGAVGWFREVLPHEHEEVHAVCVPTSLHPCIPRDGCAHGGGAKEVPRA